jgi:DNA-directed RNA polymerase specialized sigma24 family protein
MHDAQDLTQSFFVFLLDQKIYARADRRMGKFRSFLLAALKNFLANAYDHSQAFKRGGGCEFVSLDEDKIAAAESLYQTKARAGDASGADRIYEWSWAKTLVHDSLEQLSTHYRDDGQEKLFQALRIFLIGSVDSLPSYADLAHRLGVQASTLRSHVTRLRGRYRDALRAEVRRTVESDAEVEGELRELLRVLTTA